MSPGRIRAVLAIALFVAFGTSASVSAQPFVFNDYLTNLPGVDFGTVSAADVDRDGRYEILVTGRADSARGGVTSVLATLASERTTETIRSRNYDLTDLPAKVWASAAAWADFDRDGWLDLALLGAENLSPPYQGRFVVLRGSEEGLTLAADLMPLHSGSVTWVDWDRDGQDELVGSGIGPDGAYTTALYDLDDEGAFVEQTLGLPGYAYGKARAVDYDGDGDEELFLMGARANGANHAAFYFPDGSSYASMALPPGTGGRFGSLAVGELDGDGLPDLMTGAGTLSSLYHQSAMSHSEGEMLRGRYDGLVHGALQIGDVNVDGVQDLIQVGALTGAYGRQGSVYSAAPAGEGLELSREMTLPPLVGAAAALADEEGDGDLELILAGQRLGQEKTAAFYRNDAAIVNRPPQVPVGLLATSEGSVTTLTWQAAEDDYTASSSLSYAVVIGTEPGARDVVSPLADLEQGRRLVADEGNAGWTLTYRVELQPGTYYWRVQAIDGSFHGSAFSPEGSFVVEDSADKGTSVETQLPKQFALSPAAPTPFTESTRMTLELPEPAAVTARVYDVRGALVARLTEEALPAGSHPLRWNGRTSAGARAAAGIYLIHVQAGSQTARQRVILLR